MRSDTRTWPPMVSSLMSASIAGGDGRRQRVDGQGEHLLLHQPVAVVHLERLAHQGDRHVGADDLVAADDHEVDVGDRLGHRVALHLAGQGEVGARAGVEGQELVGPGLAVERDPQLTGHDGDRQRVGPVAVDDAGDLPLAPQAAHRARADGAPDLGGEYDFGHNGSPQVARAVSADGAMASGERPPSVAVPGRASNRGAGPERRSPTALARPAESRSEPVVQPAVPDLGVDADAGGPPARPTASQRPPVPSEVVFVRGGSSNPCVPPAFLLVLQCGGSSLASASESSRGASSAASAGPSPRTPPSAGRPLPRRRPRKREEARAPTDSVDRHVRHGELSQTAGLKMQLLRQPLVQVGDLLSLVPRPIRIWLRSASSAP